MFVYDLKVSSERLGIVEDLCATNESFPNRGRFVVDKDQWRISPMPTNKGGTTLCAIASGIEVGDNSNTPGRF